MTSTARERRTETALRIHGPCRHCKKHPGWRPRRLCSTCYYDPGIRPLYIPKRNGTAEFIAEKRIAREDAKEAKKLAKCKPDELPCITCSNIVQVNPLLYARAMRVQCPWSICEDCKRSVGTVRDNAVGMRGSYGDDDE